MLIGLPVDDPALAWRAGAVLVRPFRADALVAAVAEVLDAPQDERRCFHLDATRF